MRKKCPKREFFLVRIFPYLDSIQKKTDQKTLRIWTLFTQCEIFDIISSKNFIFHIYSCDFYIQIRFFISCDIDELFLLHVYCMSDFKKREFPNG